MTFFVTFPQKYRTEAHPSGLMAHPNGYWIINAASYQEAENLAFKYFGASTFDEIFGQAEFDASLFPQGKLGLIESTVNTSDTARPAMRTDYQDNKLIIEVDLEQLEGLGCNLQEYQVTDIPSLGHAAARTLLELREVDSLEARTDKALFTQLIETCIVEANRTGDGVVTNSDNWMD